MFARRVYMHLKPNSVAEFAQRLGKEIIPLLRKQAYNHGTYPEATKILAHGG